MVHLHAGPLSLVVNDELGGGIARFDGVRPDGSVVPLMRPSTDDAARFNDLACYVMMPWVNRIERGRFRFGGVDHTLIADWDDKNGLVHAIHGVVCRQPLEVVSQDERSCRLRFDSGSAGGGDEIAWPWAFVGEVAYALQADALEVELRTENRSDEPMPVGFGLHPYFLRDLGGGDEIGVKAGVAEQVPTRWLVPDGEPEPSDAADALTRGTQIGDLGADAAFTGWDRRAEIGWPGANVRITMTADEPFSFLHLFTQIPTDERSTSFGGRLPFVAVEPQTSVGNSVNLAAAGIEWSGLRVLEPGGSLAGSVRFGVELN